MQLIWAIILCPLLIFLFWFIGHITTRQLGVKEENKLLDSLMKICLGASGFLIIINLIGTILRNFHLGLIVTFVIILFLIFWQIKEFKSICDILKSYCDSDKFSEFIKENTDKYFWILCGVINFIYGLTAFSTTKLERFGLGNLHVFNVNQLIVGNYPPKYSFLPNLDQKFHYGADILAATISQLTGLHPEISLDILSMIFLNLSFLTLYALAIKYIGSKKGSEINKYVVPFAAFLAWGPVTNLFTTQSGESIPQKFLEKAIYLTQTRLIPASWSGLVLHWFFDPVSGISIFFFLIALFLTFRFFEQDRNLRFVLMLSVFLSSLVIIDFIKFVLLFLGIVLYLAISSLAKPEEATYDKQKELLKYLGIIFLVSIVLGFIHGNALKFGNNFVNFANFYNLGKINVDNSFNPFASNTILLLIFTFGFYRAYKLEHKWIFFIIPFFVCSLILPYLVTIPGSGGKILMCSNLMGAFSLPLVLDYVQEKYNLKDIKLVTFYSLVFIVLSMSTLMFWAFGDKGKPLFKLEGTLKYTGLQVFPYSDLQDEQTFLKYLKSKQAKNQTIVTEPQFAEFFSTNTSIYNLYPPPNTSEVPIKKEILDESNLDVVASFSLDGKFWLTQKINWLYITPRVFRFLMSPQARQRFLNAYLNKGAKLSLSNKSEDLSLLKELYQIDPHYLSSEPSENFPDLLKRFIKLTKKDDEDIPLYVKQAAICPYLGIYNAKSNDFDGDKISDIAFFDHSKKSWFIIYGNNQKEAEIDLSTNILANYKGNDLFIPVPSDYDGDSKTDIALFNRRTGGWYILKSSNSQVDTSGRWGGHYGEFPMPSDLDGDLKADYSAYASNNGNWPTLLTTTNSYFDNIFDPTLLDIPAYSDVDGDKKADYIIYRSNLNRVDVYLSSRAYNKSQFIQVNIGGKNARIVPSDYDGDGKADLATWTPEEGKWEIVFAKDLLNSAGNSVPHQTLLLGKVGDIPMPGDYNGDGKTEVAIYHINSSELEIILSNDARRKIDLSKYKKYIPASFIGV